MSTTKKDGAARGSGLVLPKKDKDGSTGKDKASKDSKTSGSASTSKDDSSKKSSTTAPGSGKIEKKEDKCVFVSKSCFFSK